MSVFIKHLFLFFVILLSAETLYAYEDFSKQLGKHFVVYYDQSISQDWARDVLNKAENYYDTIAETIGYARYGNFWTWDDRCKIVIYANQKKYLEQTHQPEWSTGFVVRDYQLFDSRIIFSYFQEESFQSSVLPHEISHLILRDFIGFDKEIPLWLDEGVAQYFEESRRADAEKIVKVLVKNQKQLAFNELFVKDIKKEKEGWRVLQFYAQSVSMVDFLISKYGSQSFGEMCQYIKNNQSFELALKNAYNPTLESVKSFEEKWLNFIRNFSKKD